MKKSVTPKGVEHRSVLVTSSVRSWADHLRVQRILRRTDDDAVLPVGGALAREDEHLAVGAGHDVVHEA